MNKLALLFQISLLVYSSEKKKKLFLPPMVLRWFYDYTTWSGYMIIPEGTSKETLPFQNPTLLQTGCKHTWH